MGVVETIQTTMELKGAFLIAAVIDCSINLGSAGEIIDLTEPCELENNKTTSAVVTSMLLDGCNQDEDSSCVAFKGQAATGKVMFNVTREIKNMTCGLAAYIGDQWIPFPGCGTKYGCEALEEGDCPIKAGSNGTIDISITVPSFAPTRKLTGMYKQMDGDDTAICVTFPMNIKRAPVTHNPNNGTTESPAPTNPPTKSPITQPPKTNSGDKFGINVSIMVAIMAVNMF